MTSLALALLRHGLIVRLQPLQPDVRRHARRGSDTMKIVGRPAIQTGGIPMKRLIGLVCLFAFVANSAPLLAVDGKKAQYIGGTIAGLKENAEGRLLTTAEDAVTFAPDKKDQTALAIPYAAISELEYGQKAGRR